MKQVIRRVIDKKGVIALEELPTPHMGDNQALVSTHYSLISSGTESATLQKTPTELVKQTIQDPWMRNAVKNLIFAGGLRQTSDTVLNELTLFRLIGYSGAGVVLDHGKNIRGLHKGDRVAFAAQGHAEQVAPYANHLVKVPDNVDLKHAAFVTVGGIALQGVRRSQAALGDWTLVYGLGLVGQLTVQILLAAGTRVIGIDINPQRLALAQEAGMQYAINPNLDDPIQQVLRITQGKGADATLICAYSTKPDLANNAMKMTRKQGRVVFVGLVKMDLERKPFFLNELDLSFSRAYGPGSYDAAYEDGRVEYPYHYVRWTEKRNLEEVLRLIADQKLHLDPLIDSVMPLDQVQQAFEKIQSGNMKSVAMVLSYPGLESIQPTIQRPATPAKITKDTLQVGIIGTGNFARNFRIPALARHKQAHIRGLCSASGINAGSLAKRWSSDYLTSDYHEILSDQDIDLVLIATRHDLHAQIVQEALHAGKHVLVEKPVAMTLQEWQDIRTALEQSQGLLFVGYNRRYSSLAAKAKTYITQRPIMIRYTVNIQHLPDDHWTLDQEQGGGRLLGESDHFFDLMNDFSGSRPTRVQAQAFPQTEDDKEGLFNFTTQVEYENHVLAQLLYTSLGGPKVPREKIELFCGNHYLEIEDFKTLRVNGKTVKRGSDMGQEALVNTVIEQLRTETDKKHSFDSLWAGWIILQAHEDLQQS